MELKLDRELRNIFVKYTNIKVGFTLAEVLIALTLLGVICAFLIPAIMGMTPSRNKIMFRKAYYTIEKTLDEILNNENNYPTTDDNRVNDSNGNPVWKGFNNTTPANGSGTTNKFCYLFIDALNTIAGSPTTSCAPAGATGLGAIPAVTSDGITWRISSQAAEFPLNPTSYTTKIRVDVNSEGSPNCTTDTTGGDFGYSASCKDPDRFIVGVRYDGKLQVNDTAAIKILSDTSKNLKSDD